MPESPVATAPGKADVMDAPLRKGSPLYVQLAGAFRRLITRNVWPVGSQVARVEDLAREYGVARITVRQAMDLLEREGLISRARGRGTHVQKLPESVRWHRVRAGWEEFIWPVSTAHTKVLENRLAASPPEVAPHEGTLAGPYRFLRVVTYRAADGPPISARATYLREPIYQRIKERISTSLYMALLGEHAHRITIYHEVSAATPEAAQLLEIPSGTPVIESRHVALDGRGKVVYVDFPVVRGEYVKFEITIERSPTRTRASSSVPR